MIFAAQILSVITGLIFTLLLSRNMSKQEYGIWANIFDFVGYFTLLSGLVPFWATRFVARGKEGTIKTGISASLILGLISMAIYLPLISLFTDALNISETYVLFYLIASLQILNLHVIGILEGCVRAMKPHVIGYGLLVEEVSKVSLALVLIVGLRQMFLGAMLSLIVSSSIQTLYYMRFLSRDLMQKIQWKYLREWLKGSTANLYNAIGTQLAAFVLILLFLYGGQAARGEYQAAITFANTVGYSSFLAFALYPKLLARNSLKDVGLTFRTVLMFATPMATITITMSKSLLTILNVFYGSSSPILILLTLDTFVLLISQFYNSLVLGTEGFDQDATISFNNLIKSRMFKVFTIPYIQAAIALPTTYYVLTQLPISDSVQAVSYVTIINMSAHVATFLGLYAYLRSSVKMPASWRNVGKYLFASAITGAELYILPNPTTVLLTFAKVACGVATYAALLLAIDTEARELVTLILHEIKGIFRFDKRG